MCSPAEEAKIKDKIEEFVTANKMFSAYDITLSLRNGGMRVSHRDVRRICHACLAAEDIFDDCWTRTMHDVPGTTASAYIFHHEIAHDLEDYEPVQKDYQDDPGHVHPIGMVPTTNIKQALVSPRKQGKRNKQPKNGSLNGAMTSADGRLYIPAALARQAKLKGKLVAFLVGNDEIFVTNKQQARVDGWSICTDVSNEVDLHSDDHHNIRIPAKLTQKIGKASFDIVVDGSYVKAR